MADETESTGAPARTDPPQVLPRFTLAALTLAAIGVSLLLIKEMSSVIAPVFLALNLAIAAYPVFRKLVRMGAPRVVASVAMGITVVTVLLAMVTGMSWSVAAMVTKLGDYSDQFNGLYQRMLQNLSNWGFNPELIVERVKGIDPQSVISVVSSLAGEVSGAGVLTVVIITALIFFTMDTPSVNSRLHLAESFRPEFVGSLESFVVGIRRYWVVTTIFGLIVAFLDWVVLLIVGIPLSWVWAIFSFLTNYVPNIGFVIGVLPPVLLALFQYGPVQAGVVFLAYALLNFVIQALIQPKFTGDAVGVTATVSFLSLLLWTWALGALGALLALPATLLVKALLIDTDPRTRWINTLISSRPETIERPT